MTRGKQDDAYGSSGRNECLECSQSFGHADSCSLAVTKGGTS